MEYVFGVILGLVTGTFLNICVHRLSPGRAIVQGGASCPFCGSEIPCADNSPVVSFRLLRSKCQNCSKKTSIRCVLVAVLTAMVTVALIYYFSFGIRFFIFWIFSCALIVTSFIDLEHQEIPDIIIVPGIAVGVVLMMLFKLDGSGSSMASLVNSILGVVAGAGSMFLMGFIGKLLFRKDALGDGDVKLMAMIGAFLGWKLVVLTFFIAPFLALVPGLYLKFRCEEETMPYGPYLALGAIVALFAGTYLVL